jgi:hypothetical protein
MYSVAFVYLTLEVPQERLLVGQKEIPKPLVPWSSEIMVRRVRCIMMD